MNIHLISPFYSYIKLETFTYFGTSWRYMQLDLPFGFVNKICIFSLKNSKDESYGGINLVHTFTSGRLLLKIFSWVSSTTLRSLLCLPV